MPYCTLDDIKQFLSETSLIQLTDDDNLGVVDEAKVNAAIAEAEDTVDNYLRGRYDLPLASIPPTVKRLTRNLAKYHLYLRRFQLDTPEGVTDIYEKTMKELKDIQAGVASLGNEDKATTPAEPGEIKTNKTADDRVFSKMELKKF